MLLLQTIILACAVFPSSVTTTSEGNTKTTNARGLCSVKDCDKEHNRIRKRLIELQTRPDNEAALLQAGILFANYPQPHYGNPAVQENVEGASEPAFFQQGDAPHVSRHPTKPVYHYTPLPPGTFSAQPIQEDKTDDERLPFDKNYLYNYVVRDKTSLLDMGQREIKEGNLVRGMYHVLLPDRRMQVVNYWSDLTGYHPTITYN